MGKVLNFNDKSIEYLNEDIEYYLDEIEELLADELFDDIREKIMKKIKPNSNYFFIKDLMEYVVKKNEEVLSEDDIQMLKAMELILSNFFKTFDERLRLMALNGQAILWRDSESPNVVALILHKKIDAYDIIMTVIKEFLLKEGEIDNIPFKYILPSSECGTYEEILEISNQTLCLDPDTPTDEIINALKKNCLERILVK